MCLQYLCIWDIERHPFGYTVLYMYLLLWHSSVYGHHTLHTNTNVHIHWVSWQMSNIGLFLFGWCETILLKKATYTQIALITIEYCMSKGICSINIKKVHVHLPQTPHYCICIYLLLWHIIVYDNIFDMHTKHTESLRFLAMWSVTLFIVSKI